jgi:4'-phosphopantetheinyl transferase
MNLKWKGSTERVALPDDEVHVWRVRLTCQALRVEELTRFLAEDERDRAKRFHFDRDRNRFIIAHSALRIILGKYLNSDPARIRFNYSAYGKPELAEEFQASGIEFNLSHSHDLALIAVTRHRQIGIDLELIRPGFANEKIAEHFFSPQEVHSLRALERDKQDEAFFNCWTRKEAYIKARGEGLSIPLDEFDVSLAPGEPAALLKIRGSPEEVDRWTLCELTPARGFAGAMVVEGHHWRVKCWELPDWFFGADG